MPEEIPENIHWKLYTGDRLGFSVTKGEYLYEPRAKTMAGVEKRAKMVSKYINKPVIVMKRIKYGKEECYKIFFPEGGYIGCEALIKKTMEDYRKKYQENLAIAKEKGFKSFAEYKIYLAKEKARL